MTGHDHDDAFADLLRRTLTDEADAVMPAGDGLSRIRTKLDTRRRRMRWLRPAMALGSAAAVALIGVGAYAIAGAGGNGGQVNPLNSDTPTPEPSPSETVSPSPTDVPVAARFPGNIAIWPFTDAKSADTWQSAYDAQGSQPWAADAQQVAKLWVASLGITDVDQVLETSKAADDSTAVVTLGRTMTQEQQTTVSVTDVQLVHYGEAWVVTGAADAQGLLSVDAPAAGDTVSSPVTVTGPTWGGSEESVNFDLRQLDADGTPVLGTGNAFFGNGPATWSTTINYSLDSAAPGVLVGTELSLADGGTQRLVAERVDVSAASSAAAVPHYFYGIKDQRVTKFASSGGASIEYLTDAQPGGGATDPQLEPTAGELVYYLQGGGSCVNALMSVTTGSPHETQTVATPESGYVISGYSVGPATDAPQPAMAFVESACDPSTTPQQKLVMTDQSGHRYVTKFEGNPPAILGDPVLDTHNGVFAVLHTGTQNAVVRYSMSAGNGPYDYAEPCSAARNGDFNPQAIDWTGAADGSATTLWIFGLSGSHSSVGLCDLRSGDVSGGFNVDGAPSDISAAGDGPTLVATNDGDVWRWDGSGPAVKLSPSVKLFEVTW